MASKAAALAAASNRVASAEAWVAFSAQALESATAQVTASVQELKSAREYLASLGGDGQTQPQGERAAQQRKKANNAPPEEKPCGEGDAPPRKRRKKLTKVERRSFTESVDALRTYKEEHGHLDVTRKHDPRLATFCENVRYAYYNPAKGTMRLSEERVAMLDAMGFSWERRGTNYVRSMCGHAGCNERQYLYGLCVKHNNAKRSQRGNEAEQHAEI